MKPTNTEPLIVSHSGPRLLFVTGKGGVGKSAIATALAAHAARSGRRAVLVVEQQSGSHPQLGVEIGYRPVAIEPNLDVCSVDGRSALKEYVQRTTLIPGLYDWFLDSKALQHFTEAAPGFEELMCLGKLYDLVTHSRYELIVFDGPATGHAALMLRTPRATVAAVRTGPLHHNALKIQLMLENDLKSRVVVVALPEEMAVREASELAGYVQRDLAMHLAPLVVNRVTAQLFDADEIRALSSLSNPSATLARMIRTAVARYERAAAEAQYIHALRREHRSVVEVPQIVLARHEPSVLIDGIAANLAAAFDGKRNV